MHVVAIIAALLGLVFGALGYPWFFVGFGLSLVGVGLGWLVYRERRMPMKARAVGAVAMGFATAGTVLAATRIALTVLALEKVRAWLGG